MGSRLLYPYNVSYTIFPAFCEDVSLLCFWHILFKAQQIQRVDKKNEICLVVAVIGYIGSFMLPKMSVNIHGFFAVVILLHLFAKYDTSMPRNISILGRYSLEIYVFHWFMLPQLSGLYPLFVGQSGLTLDNKNFIILMVVAGAIAACIAVLCIVVA